MKNKKSQLTEEHVMPQSKCEFMFIRASHLGIRYLQYIIGGMCFVICRLYTKNRQSASKCNSIMQKAALYILQW